jgi:hypothetical protein
MSEVLHPQLVRRNDPRIPIRPFLPQLRERFHQFGRKAPQLAAGRQSQFRIEPASLARQFDDARRTMMPAGMKSKAPPVLREVAHVRLSFLKPMRQRAGIITPDRLRVQAERPIDVLAQPGDPHRVISENSAIGKIVQVIKPVQ